MVIRGQVLLSLLTEICSLLSIVMQRVRFSYSRMPWRHQRPCSHGTLNPNTPALGHGEASLATKIALVLRSCKHITTPICQHTSQMNAIQRLNPLGMCNFFQFRPKSCLSVFLLNNKFTIQNVAGQDEICAKTHISLREHDVGHSYLTEMGCLCRALEGRDFKGTIPVSPRSMDPRHLARIRFLH